MLAAKDRPCPDCGGKFPPEAMDFDHVIDGKRFTIGQGGLARPEQELRDEVARCEVVCAPCHRLRTERRRTAREGHA